MNNLENHDADAAAPVSDGRTATTAHTPGPWQVVDVSMAQSQWIVGDVEGGSIADCEPPGPWVSNETAEANARLIAAAPDLLSAAQHLSRLSDGIYAQISPLEIDALQIAWRAMDEAIAKATGAA